jgi:two-component system chemotaxis response regulator CheY
VPPSGGSVVKGRIQTEGFPSPSDPSLIFSPLKKPSDLFKITATYFISYKEEGYMTIIDSAAGTRGRILIIDDEEDVRNILKMHLESAGYMVIEAEDGEDGINKMREGANLLQVGLIITDIRMPKVNGVEAINYLRTNAPSKPILVITGYPDADLAISLLKKGVKEYLVKPIEKKVLLEKVKKILASPQEFSYA